MKFVVQCIFIILCGTQCLAVDTCTKRIEVVRATASAKCVEQLTKLCQRNDLIFTLWDSSSRQLHSGLIATNNEDLGNYDLCMSVDDADIKGKFCPFQWATQISKNALESAVAEAEKINHFTLPPSKKPKVLERSLMNVVRQEANPDYNITLVGSICIPDACSPEEFTAAFNPYIYPVSYAVRNASTNCITKDAPYQMTTFEIVVTAFFGVIFLIVILSTAFHCWLQMREAEEPHDLVRAFSAIHNGKKLIEISRGNPEQIQCMHGLRFLSMLWVIAGHTFACSEILPHFNEDLVKHWRSNLYTQYILAGPYAVDTFFFLSGLLLAYGYMKQMKDVPATKQASAIPLMILHRYLRLTPAVAALFFASLSFVKPLGSGPLWLSSLNSINEPCRKYWWRYFLYIQNYSKEICYTQTWYLSADMQMFLLAPIVLIPASIYYRQKLGMVISSLSALIVFCVALTIGLLYALDDYNNDYDTHSRLSDYLVGIIGGIILHTFRGKSVKVKKTIRWPVWILVLAVMTALILCYHDVIINPTKDKTNLFAPIQRPIWSACILWIVFACHNGYGGIINKFLSISFFQIGSKLSYCMYCIHALVILYNVGTTRYYLYFNDYMVLYLLSGNVIACFIVSTIWTLTFESPMIILNKMLLGRLGSPKK